MIRERRRIQYLVEHKTANDGIAETRMKLEYSGISEAGKTRRKTRIYTTFTPIQMKTPKKRPKVVLKKAAFYIFCEICKLVNGDTKSKIGGVVMKNYLKKVWMVIRIWMYSLVYVLIGFPYAMWRVGRYVFEQDPTTKEDYDTLYQSVLEDVSKVL